MGPDPEKVRQLLILISVICAIGAVVVTTVHILQYRKHWTQPTTQKMIVLIILLVPIWAVLGMVIVIWPESRYPVAIPMDFYEGFAVYTFMHLIYSYLGGREQANEKAVNKTSFRTCLFIFKVVPGYRFMKVLHYCIMQFAFTRPMWSIIACGLFYGGKYDKGELSLDNLPTLITTVLLYVCLGVAMWGLFQMYKIFRVVLAPFNTGTKFMAIKFYIFLHALQGFIFTQIEKRMDESLADLYSTTQMQFCFMVIEMFIGALLNMFVFFSVKEYANPEPFVEDDERVALTSAGTYAAPQKSAYGNSLFSQSTDAKPGDI